MQTLVSLQGRSLVLHGDGGRGDVHGGQNHPERARAGGADRQAARTRHGRDLVRAARVLPRELRLPDLVSRSAFGVPLVN